ncbi:MAG: DUF3048 domain-containing protein [Oscillospiraceae bacterium]|nr:DUF3048 domain-containing protein [Oscillospiraceae bacterium]
MKRWMALFLIVVLIFSVTGCKKTESTPQEALADQVETPTTPETTTPAPETTTVTETATETETTPEFVNPLTGLSCDEAYQKLRPYGIMINNMAIQEQRVQTSLSHADIIFETYIEGYATRLLAIYKDISGIGQIGSMRSARINFAQLAGAFDSIYLHVGEDPSYCADYLAQTQMDDINFQEHNCWFREPNGLAIEHTLYTTDELVTECVAEIGERTETDHTTPWVNFCGESDNQPPAGGESCTVLSVPFSSIQTSSFHYDETTGLYERWSNGERLTDYKTGDVTAVKNVFEMGTSVSLYEDGAHMNISLAGGDGYYASEGKVIPIKWTTDENHLPVFTNTDGTPLTVNAGTSYICINLASYSATWE